MSDEHIGAVVADAPPADFDSEGYWEQLYYAMIDQNAENLYSTTVTDRVLDFSVKIAENGHPTDSKMGLLEAMQTAHHGKPLHRYSKPGDMCIDKLEAFIKKVEDVLDHDQVPEPEEVMRMYARS